MTNAQKGGVPENPQAFPHGDPTHGGDIGMTLRDWFAGQVASLTLELTSKYNMGASEKYPIAARMAYSMSDAMLAERERGK